jgi:hypothetical protein
LATDSIRSPQDLVVLSSGFNRAEIAGHQLLRTK